MAEALSGIRQKLSRVAEMAKAVKRLHDTGIVDLGNLGVTLQTAKNSRVYGPQATMAIQGGRKYPSLPAVVDERGTLTYRQVDDMSTALARGLKRLGIDEGSVVGLLCRDHRGLIIAMAACGKLGARLVLMNTGFAKPQFAQVCERENVKAVLHDSEFSDLLDALPADLPRVLTWVDEGTDLPAGVPTIDDIIAANSTEPLPAPSKPGGYVVLTSGTTGLPKGAPRAKVSPFATAELVDRVPFPRKGTMVIVSPIFHGTGLATYLVGAALGNNIVTTRRFKPEGTLKLIADHKADMLVAVPTMLHRIVELAPDVIAAVRHIVAEDDRDRRVGADPRAVQPRPGHVRRCPVQHLRIHRVRICHHRHPGRTAKGSRNRGQLVGGVRSGAVRRARPARAWRQQSGPDLHPQRGAFRGIHRRPEQASHRRLHVQRRHGPFRRERVAVRRRAR